MGCAALSSNDSIPGAVNSICSAQEDCTDAAFSHVQAVSNISVADTVSFAGGIYGNPDESKWAYWLDNDGVEKKIIWNNSKTFDRWLRGMIAIEKPGSSELVISFDQVAGGRRSLLQSRNV